MILETKRLYLRKLTQEDYQDLAEILQNSKVMYAYEHHFTDNEVQIWLDRQIQRYKQYHFGLWAVILKKENKFIGQAGLTMQPYKNKEVLEIGYLLKEEYWHKGYATEAAEACKEYAFNSLGAKKVYSIIKGDNISSIAVAKRLGMRKEDEFITRYYNGDMLHYLFAIESKDLDE